MASAQENTQEDPSHDGPQKKKRVRLSPEARRQQILDAALIEFSANGFGGASIAKIAQRVGISKANVFVHFSSKDEIFDTLLKNILDPAKGHWEPPNADELIGQKIDQFIDDRYAAITPELMAIMRLVIAEGHRAPELLQHWYTETFQPAHQAQQENIRKSVEAGILRPTLLTEHFGFVTVPLLYAVVFRLLFPEHIAQAEIRQIRETHRKLLHLLLAK